MKTRSYSYDTAVQIAESLPTDEQVRRWGWEIESPVVGEVKASLSWREIDGLEFCSDGSLSGGECECDCRDCTYHECNCDNCENYNSDPDHCGECSTNEVCSREPMTTPTLDRWDLFLGRLAGHWVSVENYGENWGGHLHIEARDLDRRQAGAVVIAGEKLFEIAPEWFTGEEDNYNAKQRRDTLTLFQREEVDGYHTNRGSWVSVHNLRSAKPEAYQVGDKFDHRKTTIEFRRFRSTPDRRLIEFRALVCRKLVEYVKTNKVTYWLTRSQTFDEFLTELGV